MIADNILTALASPASLRHRLISGGTITKQWMATDPTRAFLAAKDEWKLRTDAAYRERAGWNIRLSAHGTIVCHLTPFQQLTARGFDKTHVEALMKLHGQHPTALVLQRSTRAALLAAVRGPVWTVQPAVTAAVEAALRAYHAVRAPLRPLNAVQRLGYLDEEDTIEYRGEPLLSHGCSRMKHGSEKETPPFIRANPCSSVADDFLPGRRYPLETETIEGQKLEHRLRPDARDEEDTEAVFITGQELLIRIRGESGRWHAFTHYELTPEQAEKRPEAEFHVLAELVAGFVIPEVPDVATLHPAEFAEMQRRLRLLERGVFDFSHGQTRTSTDERRAA